MEYAGARFAGATLMRQQNALYAPPPFLQNITIVILSSPSLTPCCCCCPSHHQFTPSKNAPKCGYGFLMSQDFV